MNNDLDNPFSVTKATEFSDREIFEYWIQFNTKENVSIDALLNPKEYLPKYLIGGKGCGKTHILRYHSFPLQKIRNNNNIRDIFTNDQYIGFYSVFHGLNSSRFEGKGINEDAWYSAFEYYFELYICDNLLRTLLEIFDELNISEQIETKAIENIISLFNNKKDLSNIKSLYGLCEYLIELRRRIDSEILNAAFTRKLNYEEVKIHFSPGDLLFGIPNCISKTIDLLKDIKFIYIFDEYEKLFLWQKKFINTLVWDKKPPVTFWIGARRYGYTTRETKSGQEMKSGSEFQDVDLDLIIRSNQDIYYSFAEQLYTSRLAKYYESKGLSRENKDIKNKFCERFEEYNEDKIISEITRKKSGKEFKHTKELRRKLTDGIKYSKAVNLSKTEDVEEVIHSLTYNTNGNPLLEKYKFFFFYKLWYKSTEVSKYQIFLTTINNEFDKFLNNLKSEFDEIVDKRKKDFIAQLAKENNIKNTEYSGVQEFIKMSQGNPRTFILILKKAVEYAKIKGERPLEDGGRISLDSQYLAVHDTARWFYEDAELSGESGRNVYKSLKRLTDYFIIERFCDKPVETTVSAFYIKTDRLSSKAIACIEEMKMHSILIEDLNGRFEKNSGRKERLFQINKILAPLWNLPVVVRGTLAFNNALSESIFNEELSSNFDQLYRNRKHELNAPDFVKTSSKSHTTRLF